MKSGWFRLWIVVSCILVLGAVSASAYYVFGEEACYTFVTVSIADSAKQEDRQLAESIRKEATEKTFCGTSHYSPLLTLEGLAERGTVTQVGVSWLEPKGWAFDLGTLDVFEKKDIKTTEIINRISSHVQKARMHYAAWFVATAIVVSLATLAIGFAVGWVRRGFQNGSA